MSESQSVSGWKGSIKIIKFNSLLFLGLRAEQIYLAHLFHIQKLGKIFKSSQFY